MNTARIAKISMPMTPTPTPPKTISPSAMLSIAMPPASGVRLSCAVLTAPRRGDGRGRRPEGGRGDAEADLLALHVAAGLQRRRRLVGAGPRQVRVAGLLAREDHAHAEHDQHHRGGEQRPALSPVAGELAEHVGEGHRDGEDRQHLEEVRERRRVLERVRRVGVEEAAAVGAELLDGLLRGDRPLGDRLGGALERLDLRGRVEVLDDALRDEQQRADDADRQQDVEEAAREVDPEVAELARRAARQAADEGDGDRHAHRGRDEVLARERQHLRQVAHRRLRHVDLPVGVGDEAHGGVERVPGSMPGTCAGLSGRWPCRRRTA